MPVDPVIDLLKPERLTAVVDIGANPIDGDPPYKAMLAARLCNVVGFEPQPAALAELLAQNNDLASFLPHVIGDGTPATLNVCRAPGMTSLLRVAPHVVKHFRGFESWGEIVEKVPVETRRLDDVVEIEHLDFLKIDVQGSELAIFKNGERQLANAIAIQTEISFIHLYENQPSLGEIDQELRRQGFIPHCFAAVKNWMISPLQSDRGPYAALNQLLEADIVYVRDFTLPDLMQTEQLKHLALVAHHCYRSYDLAANCIQQLIARRAVPDDALERYLATLRAAKN